MPPRGMARLDRDTGRLPYRHDSYPVTERLRPEYHVLRLELYPSARRIGSLSSAIRTCSGLADIQSGGHGHRGPYRYFDVRRLRNLNLIEPVLPLPGLHESAIASVLATRTPGDIVFLPAHRYLA